MGLLLCVFSYSRPSLASAAAQKQQALEQLASAVTNDANLYAVDATMNPMCVCTAEQPHYLLKCNHAWCSLTGYIPDEVVGSPMFDVLGG
jgi:hypothetical protein